MSLMENLKKSLGIGEEDDYDYDENDDSNEKIFSRDSTDENKARPAEKGRNKVVNINATTQLQVVLVKPERFEDAGAIADHQAHGGFESGIHQQRGFAPSGGLFVRRSLCQQRPDEACGQQHFHHYTAQCGYYGRSFR